MRTLKKVLVGMLSAMTLSAVPALAAQTITAYEIGGTPVFTGTGAPGSTIQLQASLRNPANHSQVIGTKNEWCIITGYAPGPMLFCDESMVFNGKGTVFAHGVINEVLLENYVPQTIQVYAGAGIYAGKQGTETIQQVVFPNEFFLTIVLN